MGVFRRRYPDGRVSKDWYINYRVNGQQFKRRIGPNKKLAEQVLMDIEVKKAKKDFLGIHEAKKILFEDALTEYLNWAQVSKAPNTYTMNRFYAAHLRKTFRGYLSALTAKQVEDYKVKRRAEVSPATVNRELALIKHLCTKAVEWGYFEGKPFERGEAIEGTPWASALSDAPRDGNLDQRVLSPPQTNRCHSVTHGHAKIRDPWTDVASRRFRSEDHSRPPNKKQ